MRVRIIKEGIVKEIQLTTDENLSRGQNITRSRSLSAQYVMYSGVEIQGLGRVMNKEVNLVYRTRTHENIKDWGIYGHLAVSPGM